MPEFSEAFRAAAYARDAVTIPFFKVAWPDGDTDYFADRPYGFVGIGPMRPKILAIDTFTFEVGLKSQGLAFPSTVVTLEDQDGRLRRKIEGGYTVAGSPASVGWAMPLFPEEDWHFALTGVIGKPSFGNDGTVKIPLTAQDRPTRGSMPKAQLLPAEAPLALDSSRGLFFRLLYGEHDASALTGRGMVPCLNWQSNGAGGCRYALCLGVAKSVDRVFLNGALQTFGSDYSVSYPFVGDKVITSIDFVADVADDAIVTADAQGYETVGDGSGELILNPSEILLHLAANFAFGDWRHGAWLDPADYPIDLAALARASAFASTLGFEGAWTKGGVAEADKILDTFGDWLSTWLPFRLYWTAQGKLGAGAISHLFRGYDSPSLGSTVPGLVLRGRIHEIGDSFRITADQTVLRRVGMAALWGAQDAKFWTNLAVQDVSQGADVGEDFQLFASAAHLI